jgi:hypothetical protein
MQRLGIFIIQTIRKRTRGEGKGVSQPGGTASKLRRVTDKYAKWRLKQPRHPEAATGRASNLTQTGKMLDSMIIKRATRTSLFLGFKTQKEQDKANWVEEAGRRFMVLSGKEIKDAASFVKANLRTR